MTTFERARAIAEEHNPTIRPVRRALARCPDCDGDGERRREGYSRDPYTGTTRRDPQKEVSEECSTCGGTGAIDITPEDEAFGESGS
jgi:hypothetical protein